jgi:hypothetical protein
MIEINGLIDHRKMQIANVAMVIVSPQGREI